MIGTISSRAQAIVYKDSFRKRTMGFMTYPVTHFSKTYQRNLRVVRRSGDLSRLQLSHSEGNVRQPHLQSGYENQIAFKFRSQKGNKLSKVMSSASFGHTV